MIICVYFRLAPSGPRMRGLSGVTYPIYPIPNGEKKGLRVFDPYALETMG